MIQTVLILVLGIYSISALPAYIINGEKADIGEFPWQGSIQIKHIFDDKRFVHNCGCSLISKRWAVTAGHCIVEMMFTMYVAFGMNKLSDVTKRYKVEKYIRHQRYDEWTAEFDIALLKFEKDVEFSDEVQPIQLPDLKMEIGVNEVSVISGWGTNKIDADAEQHTPDDLMKSFPKIKPAAFCTKRYNERFNVKNHLCLHDVKGKSSACFGDSGGPAVVEREGKPVLVGIASWIGSDTCKPLVPYVYTKVSTFRKWIKNNSRV